MFGSLQAYSSMKVDSNRVCFRCKFSHVSDMDEGKSVHSIDVIKSNTLWNLNIQRQKVGKKVGIGFILSGLGI